MELFRMALLILVPNSIENRVAIMRKNSYKPVRNPKWGKKRTGRAELPPVGPQTNGTGNFHIYPGSLKVTDVN
jgi:hypothetical protein